jgi:hypothetical protein
MLGYPSEGRVLERVPETYSQPLTECHRDAAPIREDGSCLRH